MGMDSRCHFRMLEEVNDKFSWTIRLIPAWETTWEENNVAGLDSCDKIFDRGFNITWFLVTNDYWLSLGPHFYKGPLTIIFTVGTWEDRDDHLNLVHIFWVGIDLVCLLRQVFSRARLLVLVERIDRF